MNPRRWLHEHSLKLLAIRDTPNAIAGGVAIGIYFGFVPLLGLKTLLAIFFAWLTGCNILAAVIAGALHDVILPLMPVIYRWEYNAGFWLLSNPHQWPPPLSQFRFEHHAWRNWSTFVSVGKPLVLGGCLCAAPPALVSFFLTQRILARHQRRKAAQQKILEDLESNPS
jgi:uncharacterized protein